MCSGSAGRIAIVLGDVFQLCRKGCVEGRVPTV